jgi:hypothetical protein
MQNTKTGGNEMRRGVMRTATALLVAGFGIGSARADTINFGDTDFPDFAEIVISSVADASFGDDANVSLAQTFTVSNDFSAGLIYLPYECDPNGSAEDWSMTVRIFSVTNVAAETLVEGTNLYTGTFTFPNNGDTDDIARIQLSTPVFLSASVGSAGYAIQINEAVGADFNPGLEWLRPTANVYAGGVMYEDGSTKQDGERDLAVAIAGVPDLLANDDEYILSYGTTGTNFAAPGVLANDLSYDSAVLVSNLASGSLIFNSDGSFSCSDLSNGYSTFSYAAVSGSETSTPATVSLLVILSEDPPIVLDDTYVMDVVYGDHIEGNVLNNDTNSSVIFQMFAMEDDYTVANGTLTMSTNDGEFVFVPNAGFVGTNTFTYKAYTMAAESEAATVTLIVESNAVAGTVIDSFETYTNSTTTVVRDMTDALLNWNPNGSGAVEIRDRGGYGPDYQYMQFGWDSGYRGAICTNELLFGGIPADSSEYLLYCEMYPASTTADSCFGMTTNPVITVATDNRGDFSVGIRFSGDETNLTLYAMTGGGASNDVLLATGLAVNDWYGIWLSIDNAAGTYDVYLGDVGDAGTPGSLVGSAIGFGGSRDLVGLVVSSYRTARIDDIIELDPDRFILNQAASLYGISPATNDTIRLSIGLNLSANAADYWPVSSDGLVASDWVPVAHADAPDGTFEVTNLSVASGDATNKVIYVKATDAVGFFRIENNQ